MSALLYQMTDRSMVRIAGSAKSRPRRAGVRVGGRLLSHGGPQHHENQDGEPHGPPAPLGGHHVLLLHVRETGDDRQALINPGPAASATLIRASGYCVAAFVNHEERIPKKTKAPRA